MRKWAVWFLEKLAHFDREVIPERRMHAKGSGAYGTFTVTHDITQYTRAKIFSDIGKKTELFARFSTVAGERGAADAERDIRGFALKFYTEQGNFDIVGNNTPVFFIRDPAKFPDFVHSQKKNPRTNLPDAAAMFEFWANHPQSLHQMTILMSDRGIPASYRHVNGYSSHTLSMWNKDGVRHWVKWQFKTKQGIKTLTDAEAAQQPALGAQKDLVESIDNGDFPKWAVKIQVMTEDEAKNYAINPFDLTKVWPHKDFPLIEIGELELNRNVDNFFAENEQSAFSPSNLVPGVGVSPDKVLQARLLAYPDAQRYRVGANYNQLPVNAPRCPVHHYQRDGAMAGMPAAFVDDNNQGSGTNFYPNDNDSAPRPNPELAEPAMPLEEQAWLKAYDTQDQDNFSQAGDLFRIMNESQKDQLANNIAGGLSQATQSVQARMLEQFQQIDAEYAQRVKTAIESLG